MKNKNNLIIAAHPDDEIIGCGGTIKKLIKQKENVFILFLAEGVTARYEYKNIGSLKANMEIEERKKNALKANSYLGVNKKNIFFLNNFCCRMDGVPLIELTKVIEKYISKVKPYRIFTHVYNDLNIDHKLTFEAVTIATRPKKINSFLKEILCFEILSSTNYNYIDPFKPNLFIDISNHIKAKISALSKYKKEVSISSGRDKQKIKTLAQYRGIQSGVSFAEGFYLLRKFV